MRDTIEYRSAAVEIRGEADAPRLYLRAIAAGEQAGDSAEVFDALPDATRGRRACRPAPSGEQGAGHARQSSKHATAR